MIAVRILAIILILSFSTNSWAENPSSKTIEKTIIKDNSALINEQNNNNKISENLKNDNNLLSKIVNANPKNEASFSLMFSGDEITKLEQALDAYKNNAPFKIQNNITENAPVAAVENNIKSYVYLGSILYHSPNNWSVWIGDQKISAKDNNAQNELYIKSISNHQAQIVWTMSISKWKILANKNSEIDAPINAKNQVEFNFTLGFNQTFMLSDGKIVEGKMTSSNQSSQQLNDNNK